ncbi:Protein CBG15317 [Caenorhabditis briggsae]|uniref:Protein CBG15317 n=1 Tax=Caenorhabditis briggsae TaxID=6238 RepID=A8XLX4_CAEBR|nr:Protein CBG15317 [Caenorhabditis briggsae]CAP33649.2 Protein CBG15317 [Caenorhabditis briggsae]
MMRTSMEPSDTIRYIRRKEEVEQVNRPAPPPYIGQAIPRVKPIKTFQKGPNNNSVGESSRPTSRRFDTFGENALETIYDQFKFLDESEEPPTAAQTPTSVNSSRPIMAMNQKKKRRDYRRPAMILYCILPCLELLAAIAILVTSFSTDRRNWETHPKTDVSDSTLASEAIRTLSIQNALSTVIPAFFQILSSFFGFWPLFPSFLRKPAQILHIFFNGIVIVLWFDAIYDLFFKVSMEHVLQTPPTNSDEKFVINLIIGCFVYFATVILSAITLAVTVNNVYMMARKVEKSLTAISISLGTVLFSLATLVIGVFMAQANLGGDKNLSDNSTMYAYGLKEAIVFVFIVIVAIFSLIVTLQHNPKIIIAAITGQGISILSISSEIFTSDRISAIFSELKSFETAGSTVEIGIVLLNGCAVASLLLLVLQFIIFVFCVSPSVTRSPSSIGSTHSLLLMDNNRNSGTSQVERTAF